MLEHHHELIKYLPSGIYTICLEPGGHHEAMRREVLEDKKRSG